MDNDSSISCSECKFYFSFGDGDTDGECRKNPPVINIIGEDAFHSSKTLFPVTNDLLWCGSFMRSYSIRPEIRERPDNWK